jgi:hypothetical protein
VLTEASIEARCGNTILGAGASATRGREHAIDESDMAAKGRIWLLGCMRSALGRFR